MVKCTDGNKSVLDKSPLSPHSPLVSHPQSILNRDEENFWLFPCVWPFLNSRRQNQGWISVFSFHASHSGSQVLVGFVYRVAGALSSFHLTSWPVVGTEGYPRAQCLTLTLRRWHSTSSSTEATRIRGWDILSGAVCPVVYSLHGSLAPLRNCSPSSGTTQRATSHDKSSLFIQPHRECKEGRKKQVLVSEFILALSKKLSDWPLRVSQCCPQPGNEMAEGKSLLCPLLWLLNKSVFLRRKTV